LPLSTQRNPERHHDPSPAVLRALIARKEPVVLCFSSEVFPAITRWTPVYLASRLGRERVRAYVNATGTAFSQHVDLATQVREVEMPFGEVIAKVFGAPQRAKQGPATREPLEPPEHLYLRLRFNDERVSARIWEELEQDRLLAGWLDPAASGVWIGHGGNRTPLHSDSWDGLLAQAWGRKRAYLFPPAANERLAALKRSIRGYEGSMDEIMRRSPKLRSVNHYRCEIGPGEALYIPRRWEHDVETLDASVSLVLRLTDRPVADSPDTEVVGSRPRI
jgi:hypothetical protein